MAAVASVSAAVVATVVAPVCIGLVLGASTPGPAVGWAVILGLFTPALLFPFGHALTHRFLTGAWPGWTLDRRRWVELVLFGLWSGALLGLTLARVVPPGPASLVWPAGILVFTVTHRWRRGAGTTSLPSETH